MGRKKKPFIDRRTAATFQVVARSQRDPLINTSAPPNVLLPESMTRGQPKPLTKQQRLDEQAKYGIHFEDDDYDYLQHLKDVNEVEEYEFVDERYRIYPTGQVTNVPPSMLASERVQLKVGLLNQAIAQSEFDPTLDADVIAALDDDRDADNELEDDFVERANAASGEPERGRSDSASVRGGCDDDDDESRFSGVSAMTCSTMRRSEGLQLLDRRFDRVLQHYDANSDDDAPPQERSDGVLRSLSAYANLSRLTNELNETFQADDEDDASASDLKRKALRLASVEHEPTEVVVERKAAATPFDCESIISYSSTLYNHPTVIGFPSAKRRRRSTAASVRTETTDDGSASFAVGSRCSTFQWNARDRNETTEEKRLRKKLAKSAAMQRRAQKKATKVAFKTEELRNKLLELNTLRNLHQIKLS